MRKQLLGKIASCFLAQMTNLCWFVFQKEKVKVYIDEKYHHAMDPSIRPHKNKLPKIANPLGPGTETNVDGIDTLPAGNSAPSSEKPSRSSTLVRQVSDEGGSGNNYGKDIKDIPRFISGHSDLKTI